MTEATQVASTGAMAKIRRLIGSGDARGLFGTMVLKAGSAVISFALFSLAAHAAGAVEFGRFSILFSVLSILAIVAASGQEMQVVRSWNEYLASDRPGLALGAVRYGWMVSSAGVLIVCLGFWIVYSMDLPFFRETIQGSNWTAIFSMAFLAGNCFALYSSHVTRAVVSIKLADGHYEFTWRAFAVLFLSISLFVGHSVTSTEILAVFALGLAFVIATQAYVVAVRIKKQIGEVTPGYDVRQWTPRSVRLWLASIMEASNQHLDVFLIGLLLDPVSAGAYFVAARLANAFGLATSGLNTFGTRRVPGLYFARQTAELKHALNMMAGMSLMIVVVGLTAVVIGGDYMLMIFGRTYADYYWVFLLLATGTGLTAANGAAPAFLMLTGHEGRYVTIVTSSLALRVIGFFVIIPHFGILGAAAVSGAVMIGMALLTNYFCRRLTGMDPSILRFVAESTDEAPSGAAKAQPTD
ncbi:lipopolysaccharide biosynthesis protein [Cohaesibacter marisflavi]|uniref:lipopolysaccharide biosynthesis protein n=1 Tax=Cohaesibacter marisflavi TaxID=655353 RepID=UPI0029C93311|nr:lipopolysaccharide biosynthesis protein [Cohaesibacter marisflavi]